jgi:hypothetical protein
VTNCPAGPHVTTETIAVGTTVCPVSEQPAGPTGGSGSGSGEGEYPTSAFTTVVKPTASVTVPVVVGNPSVPSGSPVQSGYPYVPSGMPSGSPVQSGNGTLATYTPVPVASSPATTTGSVPVVTAGAARNAVAFALPALMAAVFVL